MTDSKVSDQLWEEFHEVINMTSRELEDWLRADASGESDEALPDQAGPPAGQQVLHILRKRRTDLTDNDIELMTDVVARIRAERGEVLEPDAGDAGWRRRLMTLGHDPLKPVD